MLSFIDVEIPQLFMERASLKCTACIYAFSVPRFASDWFRLLCWWGKIYVKRAEERKITNIFMLALSDSIFFCKREKLPSGEKKESIRVHLCAPLSTWLCTYLSVLSHDVDVLIIKFQIPCLLTYPLIFLAHSYAVVMSIIDLIPVYINARNSGYKALVYMCIWSIRPFSQHYKFIRESFSYRLKKLL